ncbi:YifB family Mg chelatase-like AAA ATPase [Nitratiruptor sp. YY09-18]|uniref:YifB family Mg chelatase-like AAA ATPase n=1 Tax=Nitratiruptor sp. YY09-18 TaxID=2724901 RepID=UPI0019164E80|nr:YifB family Mg chelatase-like AAA ATPase [Nitratiruptor sp. YY09-18]BCD67315.1 magnesium chelatase family protein [Nitratiruptor sp. YY09-18]
MKRIFCATLDGVDAREVQVESSFINALPGISIVGLASNSIQEAKDRVKAALGASGFRFPPQKITINLSPSDLRKSGSHFDLAIALGIALQKEDVDFNNIFVFGELGLDGRVKESAKLFPLLLSLSKKGISAVVPKESLLRLAKIPGITLYGVATLAEAIELFKVKNFQATPTQELPWPSVEIKNQKYYYTKEYPIDFEDVIGQQRAKRAALIAAAGMHNLLMEGSPGCGKSMIAKRMRYILPPMSLAEILEVAKLKSLSDEEIDFSPVRPLRSPHHSATKASIFGGGSSDAKPGEVALAHNGMLFFDEFPHFSKSALEALREPLQDRRVLISRVNTKVEYKTKFLFVAAQNPCPCGNLLSSVHECRCSELEIRRYKNRISSPLLDRIDMYVQMSEPHEEGERISSSQMHVSVLQAFRKQKERGQKDFNGKLDEAGIEQYCTMSDEAKSIFDQATMKLGLSHRSAGNLRKVSRTIADIEGSDLIEKRHLLEAMGFRRR